MDSDSADVDELLLRLTQRQDETSLEVLYERYGVPIYSAVLRIVGNVSDAEEVTHEVFLKIWNKAGSFDRAKGTVRSWLMTMARRQAIDRTRSKRFKARNREVNLATTPMEARGANSHDLSSGSSPAVRNEEKVMVKEALGQLDETYREVVELSFFEGLSHSKIAARLDAPLGSVKTKLRKAMNELRILIDTES